MAGSGHVSRSHGIMNRVQMYEIKIYRDKNLRRKEIIIRWITGSSHLKCFAFFSFFEKIVILTGLEVIENFKESCRRNEKGSLIGGLPCSYLKRATDRNLYKLGEEKSRYRVYKWKAMNRWIRGKEIKAETEWTARWVFRYDKSRRKSSFSFLFQPVPPFFVQSFNVTLKL